MNLKYLFYISFILIFFPMFVIWIIPNSGANITLQLIFTCAFFIMFYIANTRKFKSIILRLLKLKVTKINLIFIAFVTLTSILHFLLGYYKAPVSYYMTRFYKFYYATILVYILPVFAMYAGVKLRTIIKIFYSMIFFIFIASIIQFMAFYLNIKFLIAIFDFFTNARQAYYAGHADAYQLEGRVFAFFSEPSGLGNFIFITMPYIFNLCHSKIKLFENKYWNFLIKRIFILLLVVCIFINRSGMYLPFCLIELAILYSIYYLQRIKKYIGIFLFASAIIISLVLFNLNNIESVFKRVLQVFSCIGDFHLLVLVEPSLATRITSFAIQIVAFTKNVFCGCGLYNAESFVNSFYIKEMPLPMITPENLNLQYLIRPNLVGLNRSVVYSLLAETGLIGFSLFVWLNIQNFVMINNVKNKTYGIESVFLFSLFESYICNIVIFFYASNYTDIMIWFMYGIILLYYFSKKFDITRDNND